jgi:hypothetical protein
LNISEREVLQENNFLLSFFATPMSLLQTVARERKDFFFWEKKVFSRLNDDFKLSSFLFFTSTPLVYSKKIPPSLSILDLESILPNFDFFVFPIFALKLGHFKVQTIFSHATNTQA